MSIEGLDPIPIETFKGSQTLIDPQDVPPGYSTDSRNVEFRLGTGVQSRPGRSGFLTFGGESPYIISMGEFALLDGVTRRLIILLSTGELWKENGDQTTTLIEAGLGSTTRMCQTTAFGRQYLAFSDGKLGTAPPRYYDDTNFFRVSQSGPAESLNASDSRAAGRVDEGWRFARIVFELGDGYRTAPGPAFKFRTSGGFGITMSSIITGPSNVVRRIVIMSAAVSDDLADTITADGVRYFFVPNSGMVLNDNTTTTTTFDVSDAELTASEDVTDLLFLVVLPEQAGVTTYNNRLVWWGGQNDLYRVADAGLINMQFDGGFTFPTVYGRVPNGWVGKFPGCDVVSPVNGATGAVFRIVADGSSQRGTIQNSVAGAALNSTIRPNTAYGGRLRARRSANLTQGSVSLYFLQSGSVVVGGGGGLTVPFSQLTTEWQDFYGEIYPATATTPTDLVLKISGGKGGDGFTEVLAPAGEYIEIDFASVYPTNQPATPSLLYVSDAGLPGNYSDNSLVQVSQNDGQAIRACFVIRGSLYVAKENSLHVVTDNGDVPQNWPVQNVAGAFGVGTPSINGVSLGEGWAIIAGRSGAYFFDGGWPQKISEEIQPTWDEIDWDKGHLLVLQVDTEQKRFWVQCKDNSVPIPPEPPTPPVVQGTPYMLAQTLGTPRNTPDIWVGMGLTTNLPITVTALGRWKIDGNSQSHTLRLFKYVDGINDIKVVESGVSMTVGSPGSFVYTTLSIPVTLEASTAYYLVSQEFDGGDSWYDLDSTVALAASFAGTCGGAIVSDGEGGGYAVDGVTPAIFVPVNLLAVSS